MVTFFSVCLCWQYKVVGGKANGESAHSPIESNPVQDNAPFWEPTLSNAHLITLWILNTHMLRLSQNSPFLSEFCYIPIFPTPSIPLHLLLACAHLGIKTPCRFCDTKSSQVVQKKKKNGNSFCIRNYFTLLCIMFLHNFYLYMNIKEYK